MTATYTFDVFSSLDGYGSYGGDGDWGGYWGKQGPELLEHRLASFDARAADGLRGHHVPGVRGDAGLEHRGVRRARPVGHPDAEHAGDGGVVHAGRPARLAGRDRRERRRRRRRRPAQGGVRRAVALARQPVAELGADGRRPGRPRPGDDLPRDHRPGPGPTRSSGVRPTSTSSCSSTGRSTATSRSSSTGPPCTSSGTDAADPDPGFPRRRSPCEVGAMRTSPCSPSRRLLGRATGGAPRRWWARSSTRGSTCAS